MKRPLALAAAVSMLAGLLCASALAAAPSGPRLAFVERKISKQGGTFLASVGLNGAGRRSILEQRGHEPGLEAASGGISWLPDGSRLAIGAIKRPLPKPRAKGKSQQWIYLVDPATGHARRLPGTRGGSGPVVSPDGSQIAFSRSVFRFHFNPKNPLAFRFYASSSTWIVATAGGKPRQLTPWRNNLSEEPSSFSPDGAILALDRSLPRRPPEAVAYHLDTGRSTLIAAEAENPTYSPDGLRVAVVSYRDGIVVEGDESTIPVGELYLINPDGSNPVRLTRSEEGDESAPNWDPSGQRLAFIRSVPGLGFGPTNLVMEINADGRCPRLVVGKPHARNSLASLFAPALHSPTWQPGPGREAGPITC